MNDVRSSSRPSSSISLSSKDRESQSENADYPVFARVDAIYRADARRILATLIRLTGDFNLAEEALQDAFTSALEQWSREGMPQNPLAWLVSVGRFKAIDTIRRRARLDAVIAKLSEEGDRNTDTFATEANDVEDDRLRLIFTCCHPALPPEMHVPLTLREVCGLTTVQIARGFLTSTSTIAQRIVRAKAKIRDERIPYQIPSKADLPERLDTVLHVIYLVFTEGYATTSHESLPHPDLTAEAIRLARLLNTLLVDPEIIGLLSLMLLHESRRAARTAPNGDLVLLADQDRTLWNRTMIAEGLRLVEKALLIYRTSPSRRPCQPSASGTHTNSLPGPFTLQAAIAAVHAEANTADRTDWEQIIGLYDVLMRVAPSPVVELNRAVAIAMRFGPETGLDLIDNILGRGDLTDFYLAHAARADLCRRIARTAEASVSYERALTLTPHRQERRFIERRLSDLRNNHTKPLFIARSDENSIPEWSRT